MEFLQGLPTWAIVILGLLVAGILTLQNIGWLLAVRKMLEAQKNKRRAESDRSADPSGRDI